MFWSYPELPLFRGLRVSFFEHPPIYSKALIGEGVFNRLLVGHYLPTNSTFPCYGTLKFIVIVRHQIMPVVAILTAAVAFAVVPVVFLISNLSARTAFAMTPLVVLVSNHPA